MRVAAVIVIGLVAGVLGYGWWHSSTHANFNVSLRDVAAKDIYGTVKGAELAFLDEAGKLLAAGKTDGKYGVVWVAHPAAGYCGPDLAHKAYAECFRTHSEWLLTWVPRARKFNFVSGACRIERAPVYFSASRDSMWTWWIPLPHVGGTPYTNYDAFIQIDSRTCAVIPHRG
jgi:hypothetical protein